jgi:hypothetical protein
MILAIGHRMDRLPLHFTFLCLQVMHPLDLPGTPAIVYPKPRKGSHSNMGENIDILVIFHHRRRYRNLQNVHST